MSGDFQAPKWAREIERYMGVKSQFVLWGNIHDIYPIPDKNGQLRSLPLGFYVQEILGQAGYSHFWQYDPFKLSLLTDTKETAKEIMPPPTDGTLVALPELSALAARLVQAAKQVPANPSAALLINHASRLRALCPIEQVEKFHYDLFNLSLTAAPQAGRFNLIFLVMDKESDLPAWYSLDNPRVRVMPIPKPDHSIRRHIIKTVAPKIPQYNELDSERQGILVSRFVDQTVGLFAREIISIRDLAVADQLEFTKIAEAVRRYKLGIPDNPWDKLDLADIEKAPEKMTKRVIGQESAVDHSLDIVKRSIFDLSGAQFSQTAQRPKGVMFLAGPTGVGKTELAKCLADLTATHFIRFDMSEFSEENSNQRLVGSPPGYVAHEVGGELTNAVKQNPFALILFDEIEKAHHKIMDIFLQILDDGRLTSGRGETVYFSDALIIFTSNLGVYRETPDGRRVELINPNEEPPAVREKITEAIKEFFIKQLNRPEILNRLGPNIVVFDFIRRGDWENGIDKRIFRNMLNNVLSKMSDSKINIKLNEEDQKLLGEEVCRDLSMGGRGIGNALEQVFVNPLARELFAAKAKADESFSCRIGRETPDGPLSLSLVKVNG